MVNCYKESFQVLLFFLFITDAAHLKALCKYFEKEFWCD